MSLEKAEFKKKKQLPAEEKKFGKKLKNPRKNLGLLFLSGKMTRLLLLKA
jgi:hypothetical protein